METTLTKMVVRVCVHQRCHQGSPCPSASSFCRGQIRQWRANPASTIRTLTQSITSHAFGETVWYHAASVDPSHHVGLVRTNLVSHFSIKSKPDHLAQRSQIDTESPFVNVELRKWSLSELQSTNHTLRMERAAWHSQSVGKDTPCASAQGGTKSHGLLDSI